MRPTDRGESNDPHQGSPVLRAGAPLQEAKGALVMVHGRGAGAADILELVAELDREDFAYLAPQAAGNTWYPYSFLSPIEQNEPWLSSALLRLHRLFEELAVHISQKKTILLGFSQGACLATEYAARNAGRYGGVVGFSGGLIGPEGTRRDYGVSLAGTPVFLGCSDVDFHIPKERVIHTAEVLEQLGGDVTTRLYPNMGHTINQDEIDFLKKMMDNLAT